MPALANKPAAEQRGGAPVQAKAAPGGGASALRSMNYQEGREAVAPGPVQMKRGGGLKGLWNRFFGGDKDEEKDGGKKDASKEKEQEAVPDLYFAPRLDQEVRSQTKLQETTQRKLARVALEEGRMPGSATLDGGIWVGDHAVTMPDCELQASGEAWLDGYPDFSSAKAPRGTEQADQQRYEFYKGSISATVNVKVGSTNLTYQVTGNGTIADVGGHAQDSGMSWNWILVQ